MKTVCLKNSCMGCMACVERCKWNCITIKDQLDSYNAIIDDSKCVSCNACYSVCPKNNVPIGLKPIYWKQGWSGTLQRKKSSSGGAATELMRAFIHKNEYVCACVFDKGKFVFKITNKEEDIKLCAGSKYVKSNPAGIYYQIELLLKSGNKVLFIGLPCQVAALNNFVKGKYNNQLYLVDLICHGTPSPQLLEMYLKERNINIHEIKDISFRYNNRFMLNCTPGMVVSNGTIDYYTMAFLACLDYTDVCYSCDFAKIERISDITLGDSWGSELISEVNEGISLILCQTVKGKTLLEELEMNLYDVDLTKAVHANHQLMHPSIEHRKRKAFFKAIKKGKSFSESTKMAIPMQIIRQDLKSILIKIGCRKKKS